MITSEGIDRNFRFLVLEARGQVEMTARLLREPTEPIIRSLLSRDNYTDLSASAHLRATLLQFR